MFCDAVLQTVDDLTSAPEKVINITDRWEPIDAPYVERVLICLSNLIAIIEMDIRKNILPRQVMADWPTDKPLNGRRSWDNPREVIITSC